MIYHQSYGFILIMHPEYSHASSDHPDIYHQSYGGFLSHGGTPIIRWMVMECYGNPWKIPWTISMDEHWGGTPMT